MVLYKCPRCQRVFVADSMNIDFDHKCNSGNPTLDNEDIVNLNKYNWNKQGIANRVSSVKARISGEDDESRTSRGNRKSTTRTRQHYEFINLK